MPVSVGTKLGPYEILAPIGAGGMGEVFKARDTRLDRIVAIKVSKEQFTERFTREARSIAALNHTNVCHLYDAGPDYLVMEYVEGSTLHGPMALDEAMPIIQQLIDGIEAAHEKNIIHRDLKLANIKVTPEGVVKILDFGLAKAMDAPREEASPENSPTITFGATEAGMILGTAAYMSPEQAKGRQADRRSDVWSFGVVVYELLTGKRPFEGENTVEILGAVMHQEPDWTPLPARMRRPLQRCLQKDRKLRLGAISDARWMMEEGGAPAVRPAPQLQTWRWVVGTAAVIACFAAAIVLAFVVFRGQPPSENLLNLSVTLPPDSTPGFLALSPDGRRLAVVTLSRGGSMQLHLRSLDSPEYRVLPGTDRARTPFWSPDSRFVAFFSDGKLKTIPATGGPATTLCGETGNGLGGTWNRDGVILFASAEGKLRRVRASGGECTPVALQGGNTPAAAPDFLDGNRFFYTTLAGVYVAALDNPKPRKVLNDPSGVVYSPPASGQRLAHLLFLRDRTLLAQAFDLKRLEVVGDPVALAHEASFSMGVPQVAASIASNGTLVYFANVTRLQQLTWLDRSGKELGRFGSPGDLRGLALSPDGNTIAFDRVNPAAIWLFDIARGSESRFTSAESRRESPVWSPDGSRIAYGDRSTLFVRDISGSGSEETLLSSGPNPRTVSDWSHDGKFLIYTENDPKTQADIWYLPDPGTPGSKPVKFLGSDAIESQGQLSPDGRWLAYTSFESGTPEVRLRPFPSGPGLWKISVSFGWQPRWSRNGKELFYLDGGSGKVGLIAVAVKADGSRLQLSAPSRLFEFQASLVVAAGNAFAYAPHPDGKRFLVAVQEPENPSMNVITNWRKLLPLESR